MGTIGRCWCMRFILAPLNSQGGENVGAYVDGFLGLYTNVASAIDVLVFMSKIIETKRVSILTRFSDSFYRFRATVIYYF